MESPQLIDEGLVNRSPHKVKVFDTAQTSENFARRIIAPGVDTRNGITLFMAGGAILHADFKKPR